MDVYGAPNPDYAFRIDDLLNLSNDDLFSPASASTSDDSLHSSSAASHHHHHHSLPPLPPDFSSSPYSSPASVFPSTQPLADDFSFPPSDDVAELEWLSRFVDDSFSDIPPNSLAGTPSFRPETAFPGKPRTKRSRPVSSPAGRVIQKDASAAAGSGDVEGVARRCTHCASEKTPQWRTGPMGPKTLCNACGVRYKSGRLVPEYRPAASPTFVLTQHSNSHRKVMELRRQKEMLRQEQIYRQQQRQSDFQVC